MTVKGSKLATSRGPADTPIPASMALHLACHMARVPMSGYAAPEFRFTSRFIIGAAELRGLRPAFSLGVVVRP
jgi:hypothetical protein